MRFVQVREGDRVVPGVIVDDSIVDLSAITAEIDGAFLGRDDLHEVVGTAIDSAPRLRLDGADLAAPIARPIKILCIGLNFSDHAAESNLPIPAEPVLFIKDPSTIVGPFDDVLIPRNSVKTDWEVELGVVIGKRASYLADPSESINHIAGFVVANDLSERTFQLEESGGQWSKGKSAAGFNPTGPWLVTPDEVDYRNLRLRSWVNGEPRQDSTTADLIFDVDFLIWHLSQYLVLDPGDLVLTGTPEGVALSGRFPYLKVGDVCEIEIEGLGRQRQEFIDA